MVVFCFCTHAVMEGRRLPKLYYYYLYYPWFWFLGGMVPSRHGDQIWEEQEEGKRRKEKGSSTLPATQAACARLPLFTPAPAYPSAFIPLLLHCSFPIPLQIPHPFLPAPHFTCPSLPLFPNISFPFYLGLPITCLQACGTDRMTCVCLPVPLALVGIVHASYYTTPLLPTTLLHAPTPSYLPPSPPVPSTLQCVCKATHLPFLLPTLPSRQKHFYLSVFLPTFTFYERTYGGGVFLLRGRYVALCCLLLRFRCFFFAAATQAR